MSSFGSLRAMGHGTSGGAGGGAFPWDLVLGGGLGLAGSLFGARRGPGQLNLSESEARSRESNQLTWDALQDYINSTSGIEGMIDQQGGAALSNYQTGMQNLRQGMQSATGRLRSIYEGNTGGAMAIAGEGRGVEGLYEGAFDRARQSVLDQTNKAGADILDAYQGGRSRTGARLSSSAMTAAGLDAIRAREAGSALGALDIGEADARAGARSADINRRLSTYMDRAGRTEDLISGRVAAREGVRERELGTSLGYEDTLLGRRLGLQSGTADRVLSARFDPLLAYPHDNYAINVSGGNYSSYAQPSQTIGSNLQGLGGYMFGQGLSDIYNRRN